MTFHINARILHSLVVCVSVLYGQASMINKFLNSFLLLTL